MLRGTKSWSFAFLRSKSLHGVGAPAGAEQSPLAYVQPRGHVLLKSRVHAPERKYCRTCFDTAA
jgi:hypothetical protein